MSAKYEMARKGLAALAERPGIAGEEGRKALASFLQGDFETAGGRLEALADQASAQGFGPMAGALKKGAGMVLGLTPQDVPAPAPAKAPRAKAVVREATEATLANVQAWRRAHPSRLGKAPAPVAAPTVAGSGRADGFCCAAGKDRSRGYAKACRHQKAPAKKAAEAVAKEALVAAEAVAVQAERVWAEARTPEAQAKAAAEVQRASKAKAAAQAALAEVEAEEAIRPSSKARRPRSRGHKKGDGSFNSILPEGRMAAAKALTAKIKATRLEAKAAAQALAIEAKAAAQAKAIEAQAEAQAQAKVKEEAKEASKAAAVAKRREELAAKAESLLDRPEVGLFQEAKGVAVKAAGLALQCQRQADQARRLTPGYLEELGGEFPGWADLVRKDEPVFRAHARVARLTAKAVKASRAFARGERANRKAWQICQALQA